MSPSIPDALTSLSLGEAAPIRGVRVVRRSLFGFQVGGRPEILDAAAATVQVVALAAMPRTGAAVRVEVCFRCAGDGLGRRDRGVCGVCHGRGIQVVEPATGWAEASPAQRTSAATQAAAALRAATHPRGRESLEALLAALSPLPASPRAAVASHAPGRPIGDLRRTRPQPDPQRAA